MTSTGAMVARVAGLALALAIIAGCGSRPQGPTGSDRPAVTVSATSVPAPAPAPDAVSAATR